MTKENEPGTLLGISVSFGYMWYLRALPRALDSSYPAAGSLLRDTGVGLVCVCVCVLTARACVCACALVSGCGCHCQQARLWEEKLGEGAAALGTWRNVVEACSSGCWLH